MPARSTTLPESLVETYDAWYEGKLSADEQLAPWHLQAINQQLVPRVDGAEVLDIGCGSGTFARYLADQRANVVAADFSPTAIDYAREHILKGLPNARAIVADAHHMPFPDESFDVHCLFLHARARCRPSESTLRDGPGHQARWHVPSVDAELHELCRLIRIIWWLRGKPFAEIGQPINHALTIPVVAWNIRRAGCRITAIDGEWHVLRFPWTSRTIRLRFPERRALRPISKWFGLHAVIRAERC